MKPSHIINPNIMQEWRSKKEWRVKGKLHRLEGPAIIWANGTQEWWVHNKKHRIDGPAFIAADGTQAWWVNGLLHKLDGPAIILANGNQHWYINGKEITREVNDWMEKQKVKWPWDEEIQAQFVLTFC
jgi:hypothetical protein